MPRVSASKNQSQPVHQLAISDAKAIQRKLPRSQSLNSYQPASTSKPCSAAATVCLRTASRSPSKWKTSARA